MQVIVTKSPDGAQYITKDGHGVLFDGDVVPGADPVTFGDNTLALLPNPNNFAEEGSLVVEFSWVDYLDTANREVPGPGVRHNTQREVPGRFDTGPYAVETIGDVVAAAPAEAAGDDDA